MQNVIIDDLVIAAYLVAATATAQATGLIDAKTARGLYGLAFAVVLGPSGAWGAWAGGSEFLTSVAAGFASGLVSSGGSLEGGVTSAFSAGLFYGAGTLADMGGAGWGSGSLGRAGLHALAGCVSAVAGGGKCGQGAASAVGPKLGSWGNANVFKYALIGGVSSVLGGGKFGNGAMSGAFGYLFNCSAHPDTCPEASSSMAADLPAVPQVIVNAVAGFGDGVSLGTTALVRELMGTNDAVDFSSKEYLGGLVAGAVVTGKGYASGAELGLGRNARLAPWGNRTGDSNGEFPHYHWRGTPNANGKTPDGQGIGRHRPWQSKSSDKSFWNRF